jgi:hypothetical protein
MSDDQLSPHVSKDSWIHFEDRFVVRWIDESNGLEIDLPDGGHVSLQTTEEKEGEFLSDHRANCIVSSRRLVSSDALEAFNCLARRQLPPGSLDPALIPDDMVASDGMVKDKWAILPKWLPDWLAKYFHEIHEDLSGSVWRSLAITLWRINGLEGGVHNPILARGRARWSFDLEKWHPIPMEIFARRVQIKRFEIPPSQRQDIFALVADPSFQAPLGHELYSEAWALRSSSPRSSLLIAIAAAETGIKEFITSIEPGATWLLQNIQSPPLIKMLTKYLPALLIENGIRTSFCKPPKTLLSKLEEAIELRNQIAHGGRVDLKHDVIGDVLHVVSDLLWMLDVFSGHEWARAFVRPEVLELWDPVMINVPALRTNPT